MQDRHTEIERERYSGMKPLCDCVDWDVAQLGPILLVTIATRALVVHIGCLKILLLKFKEESTFEHTHVRAWRSYECTCTFVCVIYMCTTAQKPVFSVTIYMFMNWGHSLWCYCNGLHCRQLIDTIILFLWYSGLGKINYTIYYTPCGIKQYNKTPNYSLKWNVDESQLLSFSKNLGL